MKKTTLTLFLFAFALNTFCQSKHEPLSSKAASDSTLAKFHDLVEDISPNSDLKRKFLSIIGDGGNLLNLKEMGFPANWKFLDVWKEN